MIKKKASLTTHWEALKFLREVGFNILFCGRKEGFILKGGGEGLPKLLFYDLHRSF